MMVIEGNGMNRWSRHKHTHDIKCLFLQDVLCEENSFSQERLQLTVCVYTKCSNQAVLTRLLEEEYKFISSCSSMHQH